MKGAEQMQEKEQESSFYKWIVLLIVIIGTFMAVLDSSIVNIAISKMMTVFGVSVEEAQWIITSYSLVMGAIIPLTGYLTDRFGSKTMYIFALAAFTLGSLLCGISWNNNIMIISRVIQGIGGGMIMPIGMSILYTTFSVKERGMALGFWGIAAMAAPTVGPTLGGYIIEYVNWRLIFTLNIPIGILGVLLAWILLKPGVKKKNLTFDYIGFITCAVGLVFTLYVLGEGGGVDWGDVKNVVMMSIGVGSLIIFVINELMHPAPLLDLKIFKYIPFTVSMFISVFTTMAMFGVIFIMPLFLQNIRGYTPIQTGLIMFPSAMVMGIMMPIGGRLADKIGAKPLVITGSILTASAAYMLSKLNMDTPMHTISLLLILRSFGLGISMMPASTEGMNSVPQHLISRATAMNSTIRQIANSVSITFLVGVMNDQRTLSFARYSEQINDFNFQVNSLMGSVSHTLIQNGASPIAASATTKMAIYSLISKLAFISGVNATLMTSAMMGLICVPIALFFKKHKVTHTEVEVEADAVAEMSFEM